MVPPALHEGILVGQLIGLV